MQTNRVEKDLVEMKTINIINSLLKVLDDQYESLDQKSDTMKNQKAVRNIAKAYFTLAREQEEVEVFDSAISSYRKAIKCNRFFWRAYARLLIFLERLNRLDEA